MRNWRRDFRSSAGQYAYLREALHPAVAFVYGWVLLLVIQTGGMAAVAVTFARYFVELTRWPLPDSLVAAGALALLTVINCLGVNAGSRLQSMLTLIAIGAVGLLELASFTRGGPSQFSLRPLLDRAGFAAARARFRRGHDARSFSPMAAGKHRVFSAAKCVTRRRLCRAV